MELWVFGYGSLIWNPGFSPQEAVLARLAGYRRSFCLRSFHYRGTPDTPGLVLALEEQAGALCEGVAFRISEGDAAQTLEVLRARELVSSAYYEAVVPLDLADGRQIKALAYVIEPGHVQHCVGLSLDEQAEIIAKAVGERGPNTEYLHRTAAHLAELGLEDPDLVWLDQRVRALTGG